MTDEITRLREASGSICDSDKVVEFIYLLGRDHLPLGAIEEITNKVTANNKECSYTNGFLAKYAQDVAWRLESEGNNG